MKSSKRVLTVIMAMLMTTSVLAGCQRGGASSEVSSAKAADNSNTSSTTKKDVSLEMVYWGDDAQKKLVESTCQAYEKATGVKVQAQVLPATGGFDQFIQTRVSSGNVPDVSYMGEGDIQKYDEMGILSDIDDLITSKKIPTKLDAVTIKNPKGKVIGVGLSNQLEIMFYSKSKFDKAGISYPPSKVENAWSWDTFVANAKKMTTDKNGKTAADAGFDASLTQNYGVGFTAGRAFHQFWAAYANGGGIVSADGKTFQWDSDATVEGIQKLADLFVKDKVTSSNTYAWTNSLENNVVAALEGGYAMVISGSWDLANVKGKSDIGVGVLPKMKSAVTMNCGGPMVVYKNSKHLDDAKDFYAYMVNPENCIDLLKSGAWLPNQANWYTDDSLVKSWTSDMSESAKETILSYSNTKGAIAQWPAYYVPAYGKMDAEYEKTIDQALTGEKTVKDVFAACMPTIKKLFESGTVS